MKWGIAGHLDSEAGRQVGKGVLVGEIPYKIVKQCGPQYALMDRLQPLGDSVRYEVRTDGELSFVFDTVKQDRLPFESRNSSQIEGIAHRLNSDYSEYLKRRAQSRML